MKKIAFVGMPPKNWFSDIQAILKKYGHRGLVYFYNETNNYKSLISDLEKNNPTAVAFFVFVAEDNIRLQQEISHYGGIVAFRDACHDAVLLNGFNEQRDTFWIGHPHLRIVNNIEQTIAELLSILGIPQPLEIERKFLVEVLGSVPYSKDIDIFQTYIINAEGSESRIRKRGESGQYVYFHTTKKKISDICREEVETQISENEYQFFLLSANPAKQTIHKQRKCFIFENQYFELDTFFEPKIKEQLLEIELLTENQDIIFPPFLRIIKDVSHEKKYRNSQIAKI